MCKTEWGKAVVQGRVGEVGGGREKFGKLVVVEAERDGLKLVVEEAERGWGKSVVAKRDQWKSVAAKGDCGKLVDDIQKRSRTVGGCGKIFGGSWWQQREV